MDFRLSPEDEAFRREVRQFLEENLPPDWSATFGDESSDYDAVDARMRKALVKKGWMTLAWPKEYGGMGASHMKQMVFNEELAYSGAPGRDRQGLGLVGPCLIVHGTEEQKREHLPKIARGEVLWCQGFSEPGAGSDLASLQTKAVRDGDDYIINGSKIWTSYAHRADWMHILTRTDPSSPKHKGISYFLLDMKTPGIEVRPLLNMTGRRGFNQVFFTNVRVPAHNILGQENRGWYVATTTLDFERSGINFSAQLRRMLEDFTASLKSLPPSSPSSLTHSRVRLRLAELSIAILVGRNLSYRVVSMQSKGRIPNMEASMSKLYSTELTQYVSRGLMDILGLSGQLLQGPRAPFGGRAPMQYMGNMAQTIGGGTSEVQRNVIAQRGLGLPRDS
ncbi:MAG: acyl-CoA dehydrogenase [Chloroflexi bacterium]|nr:acyl-CoA dehydrogenase [Chloroflexota bacterium]